MVEKCLGKKIEDIPVLKHQCELLQTVPGIGKVLALILVVLTNGFSRFDSPRALACHAGVAPFRYSSGSGIRSKIRSRTKQIKG